MSRRIPQPSAAAIFALAGLLMFLVLPALAQDITISPSPARWNYAKASTSKAKTLTNSTEASLASTETKESTSATSSSVPDVPKPPAATDEKDWEARAIVGYHQAGASSAKFTQNFFFDFFIMRSLSKDPLWTQHNFNVWGDLRIASSPQQVTAGVGTFATNFATQVSNLPVNQLAQGADFQTGLEYAMHTWESGARYRMAGLIGYFGALGEFQPPDAQMQIFNVPDKASLQYPAFAAAFPAAANAKYVGFVPPNRERFYRSFGLGVRLTTFDKDHPTAPPATYSITFGQDEEITGGTFHSVVGRFDVFYPLPLSSASDAYQFLFLFGTANLRLSRATSLPTFALQNPNANGVTVQPFDPNLAVITQANTRDTYRIGVGVDLLNLYHTIKTKGQGTP